MIKGEAGKRIISIGFVRPSELEGDIIYVDLALKKQYLCRSGFSSRF